MESLLAFVGTVNRLGYTDGEIADELIAFNRLGLSWPRASRATWMRLIAGAIADGKLDRSENGVVTIPTHDVVKQLELFE